MVVTNTKGNATETVTSAAAEITVTPYPALTAGFYVGEGNTTTATDISGQSGSTLIDKAVTWLKAGSNAQALTVYTLVLDADIASQAPVTLSGFPADKITLALTTTDSAERAVTLSSNGSLFTVGASSGNTVTLVIDRHITLHGKSDNTASLVEVKEYGVLEARGRAKITENTDGSNAVSGGGVMVFGGEFTMSGSASVSGNTAWDKGGGVYVYSNGKFTMNDSVSVFGNTARTNGGGVYVFSNGTFIMNDRASVSGNTAGYGGGVYVYTSGTFTINGGRIPGSADSDADSVGLNTAEYGAALYGSGKFGASSANCKVGGAAKSPGAAISTTADTIIAAGWAE